MFDVLPIDNPGHFAIDSGLFHVVAAAVVGDFQDLVHQVFSQTLARESVPALKFLVAVEPTEHSGSVRHPGIGTNNAKAFAVGEP